MYCGKRCYRRRHQCSWGPQPYAIACSSWWSRNQQPASFLQLHILQEERSGGFSSPTLRFFFLSPVISSIVEPRSQDTKPDRKLANQSPRQGLTMGASLAILPQQAAREKEKKWFISSYRCGAFLLHICRAIIFWFHARTVWGIVE